MNLRQPASLSRSSVSAASVTTADTSKRNHRPFSLMNIELIPKSGRHTLDDFADSSADNPVLRRAGPAAAGGGVVFPLAPPPHLGRRPARRGRRILRRRL